MTQPPEPNGDFLRRGQPPPPQFTSRPAAPPPPVPPSGAPPPTRSPGAATAPVIGMVAALLLGIAWAAGGFEGFGIALLLGAIGFVVAGQLAGRFDVRDARRRSRD